MKGRKAELKEEGQKRWGGGQRGRGRVPSIHNALTAEKVRFLLRPSRSAALGGGGGGGWGVVAPRRQSGHTPEHLKHPRWELVGCSCCCRGDESVIFGNPSSNRKELMYLLWLTGGGGWGVGGGSFFLFTHFNNAFLEVYFFYLVCIYS